ncbi:MAG: class I SAM-dependent methyltransferase [Oligoflexia bacterium]|nr:class I SAM-dependent methyltransferase [Oligoflexia bacterium]
MPDLIFENSRLVEIYDSFDGQRNDLIHYLSLAKELNANSILDIGSGTGCFACMLAEEGFKVIGLEPAEASLSYAKKKPYANKVNWILGDATMLSPMNIDLAIMTGNVAQVFLTDTSWEEVLVGTHKSLRTSGYFVFEVRDPSKKAWLDWKKEKTYGCLNIPDIGKVESWCEVLNVANELVSFRWTYVFHKDNQVITSDSTLRFRSKTSIENSLCKMGFTVEEIRDAPDRPGKELVFITKKND